MAFWGIVLSLLPFLCLFGTIWIFRRNSGGQTIFNAIVAGSLIWSAFIWLETNILSLCGLLYGTPIAVFWCVYFIVIVRLWTREWALGRLPKISGWQWVLAVIFFFTLVTGLVYPPNNYDVLAYHMPRVAHWLQNYSLAAYPTSIDRQIGMAPFNAMIALQSYGPDRLDYFVNITQWLAFVGCVVGVGEITLMLGGRKTAAICAAIFTVTLPAAIIQASNAESSLLVSFYLCVMAWSWLAWRRKPHMSYMVIFGAALGFAILSKGSAYPVALPFVVLVAWICLRHPRKLIRQGLVAAAIIISLNLPHLLNTVSGTGNAVGSAEKNILVSPGPATFATNILCNFLANEPYLLAFGGREHLIRLVSAMGIEQDDPKVFPFGGLELVKPYLCPQDAIAPNPLHALFLMLPAIAAAIRKFKAPLRYAGPVLGSFACFCVFLTWHIWVVRIQLALFILAAPICGLYLSDLRNSVRRIILAVFCLGAVWPLFLCVERPLAPAALVDVYRHNVRHFLTHSRDALLFNVVPEDAADYMAGASSLAAENPARVGMRFGENGLEYPLWRLLDKNMDKLPLMEHTLADRKEAPYIFEYIRAVNGSGPPIRVVKNTNHGSEILFPPSGGQKLEN